MNSNTARGLHDVLMGWGPCDQTITRPRTPTICVNDYFTVKSESQLSQTNTYGLSKDEAPHCVALCKKYSN
jgi:hypothetical protein